LPAQIPKSRLNGPLPHASPGGPGSPARRRSALDFALAFFLFFLFWLLFSGKFDPFHILLGIFSCLIVAYLSGDLIFSGSRVSKIPGLWFRFARYTPWLIYQVFLANIHVLYLVFHPRMLDLIDPKIIHFKSKLKDEMALVTFANSITLTPGTITVSVSVYGDFRVHAIDAPSGEALPGEMEERIAGVFET
jgi:multicomponent Na+:H+ antiporter subunit E